MRRFIGENEALRITRNSKKWKELKSRLDEACENGDDIKVDTIIEEMEYLKDKYISEAEDHNDAIKNKD